MKGIWFTWEHQRRNLGISSALDFPLHQFDIHCNLTIRYLKSIHATYRTIKNEEPSIVVAQNPSLILALFVILYHKVGRYYPIIDAHNSGIYPFEGKSKIICSLANWLQQRASLTIVTNPMLKKIVEHNGGSAFVLPDAIPHIPEKLTNLQLEGKINLTCICTYSKDEPYREVIEASRLLPSEIHIYITGKNRGDINTTTLPDNVHLTGFIPEKTYWDQLSSSDVIIDLTLREDCLVCGAYEGVALGKPLILSNTNALKKYFSKGCVYTSPQKNDIYRAIIKATQNIKKLQEEIAALEKELKLDWQNRLSQLKFALNYIK